MTGRVHIFREHNTEADRWAEKSVRGKMKEWRDERGGEGREGCGKIFGVIAGSGMGVAGPLGVAR